jgi:hypothetical protein
MLGTFEAQWFWIRPESEAWDQGSPTLFEWSKGLSGAWITGIPPLGLWATQSLSWWTDVKIRRFFSYQRVRAVRARSARGGAVSAVRVSIDKPLLLRDAVSYQETSSLYIVYTCGVAVLLVRFTVFGASSWANGGEKLPVLAGCPQWVCIWIIYLSVYVCCRCLHPCTLLHIAIVKKQM